MWRGDNVSQTNDSGWVGEDEVTRGLVNALQQQQQQERVEKKKINEIFNFYMVSL